MKKIVIFCSLLGISMFATDEYDAHHKRSDKVFSIIPMRVIRTTSEKDLNNEAQVNKQRRLSLLRRKSLSAPLPAPEHS